MKKFVVFGNCQAEQIANLLLKHPEFKNNYEKLTIPAVHTIRVREHPDFANRLPAAKIKTVDQGKK